MQISIGFNKISHIFFFFILISDFPVFVLMYIYISILAEMAIGSAWVYDFLIGPR